MEYVLGIDLGTSYFKLGLFDREGTLCGLGRVPIEKDEGEGRCELPIARFWESLRCGLEQALEEADAMPSDIVALAYSSQANTFLLLDRNNEPLTPLILWPDVRVENIDPAVKALWKRDDFLATTGMGLEIDPGLAVAKIKWFQEQQPELWAKTARIMALSDYLTFSLTGKPVGDAGTASLLGLLDVQQCYWRDDTLDLLGIFPQQLSDPLRPATVAGSVIPEGTRTLGMPAGIPFVVGGLDHHMAAIGAGVGTIAPASVSFGTVLACLKYSETFAPFEGGCTGVGTEDGSFYQLAFDASGASVLEWYQKTYASDLTLQELDRLAEAVPAGCDGLVALPSANQYPGLEGFTGRSERHGHGPFFRAIMESVSNSLLELVKHLFDGQLPEKMVATGGGAKSDLWLQINADKLGTTFVTTSSPDTACMGAAMIAAKEAGWFDSLNEVSGNWLHAEKVFLPGE